MSLTTSRQLSESLSKYSNRKGKIARMVKNGEIFPVIRGLYETDKNAYSPSLANAIYAPSYLSFESALSYYGLIPERVFSCKSATCGKRRKKHYSTPFGRFDYMDIPKAVFPLALSHCNMFGHDILTASPEKAVCDQLYSYSGSFKSQKMLEEYLFENMRYDDEEFAALDGAVIKQIAPLYGRKNLNMLASMY